jgi:tRNA uridine 5-carboxymethylaminomethyl modification enzyme
MHAGVYDVIVVGGGHAGAEAAWAAAHLGVHTALVTFSREAIGRPSCNPAVGGIGKGQIVREIDALGGLMGLVTDEVGIQFRMLNRRKGPAVWAPRAQIDSRDYPAALRRHLENCSNLQIIEADVEALNSEPMRPPPGGKPPLTDRRITGVTLSNGRKLAATSVVIASGTFLRGLMHTGEAKTKGGRVGEPAAAGLSASLASLGLEIGRLKTGTPPRIARDTVDWSQLAVQRGDERPVPFSFLTDSLPQEQVCCWLTSTNERVHDLIRANLHRAPMYSGQIQSRGPRYCPSIEDKVVRFADKPNHQVFLEPEGRDSDRIYANGISTSLPQDVQAQMVTSIRGLEHARILQWGYAVEYDFVPPEQIDASLMTKRVRGLFLAGQINGSSGYEEAAGQGIIAGINAARLCTGAPSLIIGRDQAYIGVMIDDLVTRGVTEPYRMFTSRAEHRLHLRYDNADARLTPLGREVGLVDDERWRRFQARAAKLAALLQSWEVLRFEGRPLADWIRRPEEDGLRFASRFPELEPYARELDTWGRALVEIKYAGYLQRQQRSIEEFRRREQQRIPPELDYCQVPHLRREAIERWSAVRPHSIGQAARVSGIHPTDLSVLLLYIAAVERRTSLDPAAF